MPMKTEHERETCSLSYPGGENYSALKMLVAQSRMSIERVPVDPDRMLVGWHRIRIQIFRDGTCGFALDGRVIWRSGERVPLDTDYRVMVEGNASGARVMVGPMVVWTGVRKDLDWNALPISRGYAATP